MANQCRYSAQGEFLCQDDQTDIETFYQARPEMVPATRAPCPAGSRDIGGTCWDSTRMRVVLLPHKRAPTCPNGYSLVNGMMCKRIR